MSQEPHSSSSSTAFGKYSLIAELGHGGMADVFLAVQQGPVGFNKLIVIKRLRETFADDPEFVAMLLDEARLAARLNHPNVVQTNEVGQVGRHHFIAMEYLEGQPLHRINHRAVKKGGVPLVYQARILADVLAGLHHAHELNEFDGTSLGVVHRDVTPHNILISEHGSVKLLDFGAAWSRLSGRVSSEGPTLQGSLAYAAPEHAHHLALDGRADQFSLGIVLLQLLTGRHLFEGADRFDARQRRLRPPETEATRQCTLELAARIRDYSIKDLEAATRSVPETLRPIVLRALAPERTDRFSSCAHLSSALREHLRDTGQYFGRHEVLAEVVTLRYIALRVEAGDAPDDALSERHLPDLGFRSVPQSLAGHRAARPRGGTPGHR
jgi:serine/threonine protein kinase